MDIQIRDQIIALLPRLRRFTYSLTGSHADADDLLQDTCVRAIENLDKWEIGSRLDSWMYRMAQNIHRNNIRHAGVKNRHQQAVNLEGEQFSDGVTKVIQQDELKKVALSVEQLPHDQRTVLLLVAVEGYGYQEAADILDVPIGTVTSRLARARQFLAGSVQDNRHD